MMPLKTSVMLPYLTYITYKYRAEITNSQAKNFSYLRERRNRAKLFVRNT